MSTQHTVTNKAKSPTPLNRAPPPPPTNRPPPQPKLISINQNATPLTNINSHPLRKSKSANNEDINNNNNNNNNNNIISSPVVIHPLQHTQSLNDSKNDKHKQVKKPESIPKCHRFGILLLGYNDNKQNDNDASPTLQASNSNNLEQINIENKIINKPILSNEERNLFSKIIVTILSNSKSKRIPSDILNKNARKTTIDKVPIDTNIALYSSESDHGGNDIMDDIIRESENSPDDVNNNNDNNNNNNNNNEQQQARLVNRSSVHSSSSPEPDFIDRALSPLKDRDDISNNNNNKNVNVNINELLQNNDNESDKKALAKIVSTQKEKIILMNSILKYIESQTEMDTIHRACFNLWKDWYRCYGSINNQFQQAFMAVCEKLLGNVDSRALTREPPINNNNRMEQITYDLSKQISKLKHAFAIEQLQSTPNKNGTNEAQNVSQV